MYIFPSAAALVRCDQEKRMKKTLENVFFHRAQPVREMVLRDTAEVGCIYFSRANCRVGC